MSGEYQSPCTLDAVLVSNKTSRRS